MKKILSISLLMFLVFSFLNSCSAEEEDEAPPTSVIQTPAPETPAPETPAPETPAPTQYTLTITAGDGGSVSSEGGTYDEGTEVTISATPSEGYEFVGWEGSDSVEASLT